MNPTNGCQRVCGRMDELLDGALAPVDAAFDRGHAEACGDCARELAWREALVEDIRRALAPDTREVTQAVAGVFDRLERDAVRPQHAWRGERSRAVLLTAATLAAAAVLFAVLDIAGLGVPRWSAPELPTWTVSLPAGADILSGVGIGGAR